MRQQALEEEHGPRLSSQCTLLGLSSSLDVVNRGRRGRKTWRVCLVVREGGAAGDSGGTPSYHRLQLWVRNVFSSRTFFPFLECENLSRCVLSEFTGVVLLRFG